MTASDLAELGFQIYMSDHPAAHREEQTEPTAKKRGNPNWVKGGPSPNAGGRSTGPRLAITAALRRMADPELIAAYLIDLVADDSASHRERLMAAQLILDRTEGKAIATVMSGQLASGASLPATWATMSEVEQDAWLDARAVATKAGGES